MRRPGFTFANCFSNGRKCLTEQFFPSPLPWFISPGIIRLETNAPHWAQRPWASAKILMLVLKRCFFMARFRVNFWRRCQTTRRFVFPCSKTAEAKLRTPRPMHLHVLGPGDDMVSFTARSGL